jgi:hypothetical protein
MADRHPGRDQARRHDDRDDLTGVVDVGTSHRKSAAEAEAIKVGQRPTKQFLASLVACLRASFGMAAAQLCHQNREYAAREENPAKIGEGVRDRQYG